MIENLLSGILGLGNKSEGQRTEGEKTESGIGSLLSLVIIGYIILSGLKKLKAADEEK